MRGMIYRDFELPHPAQKLADKMVILNTNRAEPRVKQNLIMLKY